MGFVRCKKTSSGCAASRNIMPTDSRRYSATGIKFQAPNSRESPNINLLARKCAVDISALDFTASLVLGAWVGAYRLLRNRSVSPVGMKFSIFGLLLASAALYAAEPAKAPVA